VVEERRGEERRGASLGCDGVELVGAGKSELSQWKNGCAWSMGLPEARRDGLFLLHVSRAASPLAGFN